MTSVTVKARMGGQKVQLNQEASVEKKRTK